MGADVAGKRTIQRFRVFSSCVLAAVLGLAGAAAAAEIRLTDDAGRSVALKQPARRIISLTPHLTELLFAAGAGGGLVGPGHSHN